MTLRNWAIGYYIVEYEQDGSDRAEYGSHLLKNLEKQIDQKGMNYTLFKACRQFYKVYPQIGSTVSSEFKLPDFGKSSTVSNEFVTDPDVLVNNLSFSHIREILMQLLNIFGNIYYSLTFRNHRNTIHENYIHFLVAFFASVFNPAF